MFLSARPSSFVCLCARLLKNAFMDLEDEMLRVDRCRDMEELINFLLEPDSFLPLQRGNVKFNYVAKIPCTYWYWGPVEAAMCSFEALKDRCQR